MKCVLCKEEIDAREEYYIKCFQKRKFKGPSGEHYGKSKTHITEDDYYAHLRCIKND